MSITNFMSKKLFTLDMDDDLGKAKSIYDENKNHHILITCEKELIGVITDRDLYKHLSPAIGTNKETPRDSSLLQRKLHKIMNRDLVTATENISLNEAILLFYDKHISCLPIVDEKMQPIGILSWRDIIKIAALQYRHRKE